MSTCDIAVNRDNVIEMSNNLKVASSSFSYQTLDTETESTISANQNAQTVFSEAQKAHDNFATVLESSAIKIIEIADCFATVDEQSLTIEDTP